MKEQKPITMQPIEKTDVYRMVFKRISDLIDSNELKPGDRLPSERELCGLLQVSRTTVRQGIKVLEAMGKVETRMGSGTYVTIDNPLVQFGLENEKLGEAFLEEIAVARAAIESMIFREFYLHHKSIANIHAIETLLAEHEKEAKRIKEPDSPLNVEYDYQFEQKVGELVGNSVLAYQQKQIHKLWAYVCAELGYIPYKRIEQFYEHRELAKTLKEGTLEQLIEGISIHVNRPWILPHGKGE